MGWRSLAGLFRTAATRGWSSVQWRRIRNWSTRRCMRVLPAMCGRIESHTNSILPSDLQRLESNSRRLGSRGPNSPGGMDSRPNLAVPVNHLARFPPGDSIAGVVAALEMGVELATRPRGLHFNPEVLPSMQWFAGRCVPENVPATHFTADLCCQLRQLFS